MCTARDAPVLIGAWQHMPCACPASSASGMPFAQVMLAAEKLGEDVDLAHIASRTDAFSGSDLKAVCTAAAMCPLRELLAASGKSAKVRCMSCSLVWQLHYAALHHSSYWACSSEFPLTVAVPTLLIMTDPPVMLPPCCMTGHVACNMSCRPVIKV